MSPDQTPTTPAEPREEPVEETDGQLSLFDQSEDGETFVSFEGETL